MVLTVAKTPKAKVRSGRRKITEGTAELYEGIEEMRRDGELLKDIAAEAGMSLEGVRKVLHRRGLT